LLPISDFAKHSQLRLAEKTPDQSSANYSTLQRPKEQRVIVSVTLTLENCVKQQQKSLERGSGENTVVSTASTRAAATPTGKGTAAASGGHRLAPRLRFTTANCGPNAESLCRAAAEMPDKSLCTPSYQG